MYVAAAAADAAAAAGNAQPPLNSGILAPSLAEKSGTLAPTPGSCARAALLLLLLLMLAILKSFLKSYYNLFQKGCQMATCSLLTNAGRPSCCQPIYTPADICLYIVCFVLSASLMMLSSFDSKDTNKFVLKI